MMWKGAVGAFALTLGLVLSLSAMEQPPGERKGDPKGEAKGPPGRRPEGGPPGGPGFRPPQPGQVLPGFLQDRLKLTDDQKKQVADLQKEVEGKLEKILTDDQKAELKKMREAGPRRPGAEGNPPPPPRKPPVKE